MMDMHLQFRIVETVKTLIIYIYHLFDFPWCLLRNTHNWSCSSDFSHGCLAHLRTWQVRLLFSRNFQNRIWIKWCPEWPKRSCNFTYSVGYPLLSIIIHQYPLLSIIIHDYPLLSMIIHDYQLLSMICWPYFQHLSAFWKYGLGQGHWWNGFCSITSSRWTSLRCEVGWCPKETIGKQQGNVMKFWWNMETQLKCAVDLEFAKLVLEIVVLLCINPI